ncbi:multidrug effflux MFS transporter [Salinibacterium sp. NK8237]|uniref:multidrug effflux MFS transporter n=1 Tax=Salinibacterium sp. NK8237 TaxID=2792038 RepID=UPI0018CF1556|nr:multidrug effflux MFS transporter [Salinibacterium sp. NK8237]MBH0131635.1 multidrug effflux MFS transporter [Salinibacterium sp. NK8237]
MTTPTASPRSGFVIGLALLAALAPFTTDMFLPSLPEIARDLDVSSTTTQLTLSVYLLMLGLSQLIIGPVSDAVGRRRPLMIGLALFLIGSLIAAFAPNFTVLLLARALQGAGGGVALVVSNASVRDRTEGAASVRLFSLLMTISGLGPILAPAIGGVLETTLGWRSVFWALGVLALAAILVSVKNLPESLPAEKRSSLSLRSVARDYGTIIRDRAFLIPALAVGSSFMVLFAYIGGASIVYQEIYGLSPAAFGLVFGGTGVAVLLGAFVSTVLAHRWPARRTALSGSLLMVLGAVVAIVSVIGGGGLPTVVVGVAILEFGLGLGMPSFMSLAMSSGHTLLGSRAALLGAMQFGFGAVATPIVGFVLSDEPISWLLLLGGLALVAPLLLLLHNRITPQVATMPGTPTEPVTVAK